MLKNPPDGYHTLTPQTFVEDVSDEEIRRRMAETSD